MIKFFINPFNILLFLVMLGIVANVLKKKYFKCIFTVSVFWFLLISTPFFPGLILDSLESRYEPVNISQFDDQQLEAEYHIIVLGGGHGFDDRLPPNSLLSLQALARLSEGIRLHNRLPNSTLVLSGYSSSGRTTQAEMLQQSAILLGVAPGATLIQSEPGNTYEEGKVYSERLAGQSKVILVTSAAHMHRAVGVFEHFGIKALPSPAHFRLVGENRYDWIGIPSLSNISKFRAGINEYAALFRDALVLN